MLPCLNSLEGIGISIVTVSSSFTSVLNNSGSIKTALPAGVVTRQQNRFISGVVTRQQTAYSWDQFKDHQQSKDPKQCIMLILKTSSLV